MSTVPDLLIIPSTVDINLLPTLMVDEDEGKEDDCRSKPVQESGVLLVYDDLTDEREGDRHAEADCDHKGRGEEHRIGPADV